MTHGGSDRWGAQPRGLPAEFDSWGEAEAAQREALRDAHIDAVQHEEYMAAEPGTSGEEIARRVEERLNDEVNR